MIRVMPNTPCLVSETAAGMAAGKHALPADLEDVGAIFSILGKCLPVTEAQIDGTWDSLFWHTAPACLAIFGVLPFAITKRISTAANVKWK